MATNLQVNAQTGQAVGAFNNLAAAIANAQGQFQNLNITLNQGTAAGRTYGNSLTQNIGGAFSKLTSLANGFFHALKMVGAGIELVFNSLLHELDKIQGFNAIMSVTTKSSTEAANSYNFLRKTADTLGVQFDALSNNYAKLVAAIPDGTDKLNVANRAFMGVAMAARTLHASNQDTQLMFYAVTQIASKGIVSMEELRRQLGEKLPGVLQIAAKALNTIPEELEKAIRKGIVISDKFLPIFGDALIRTFADSSEKAAQSVSAAMNRLTNVWVDFVKEVLDSGAGQAIVNVFDELRKKLSDPYLISRFAAMIDNLASRFASFIATLTDEDIRNGFDTFSKGVDMAVTVLTKLAEGMTWIINNSGKFGAVLGAIAGASLGATVGGLPGAAIGGAVGALGGGYVGYKMGATDADNTTRMAADYNAKVKAEELAKDQALVLNQMLMPILTQFKGLKDYGSVAGLFKPENLTRDMVSKLGDILGDKRFKTDSARAEGAMWLSKTGQILSPADAQLKDVLGGNPKKDPHQRKVDATMNRAWGFDANFFDEWKNLTELFKSGKLDIEMLEKAQADLLSKQPFLEARVKAEKEYNKQLEVEIDMAFKQVAAREKMNRSLADAERFAGMRAEDLQIEQEATQYYNSMLDVGYQMTMDQVNALKEKLRLINEIKLVSAAESNILTATVDKYKGPMIELRAIQNLIADPMSGFTQQNATDYIVNKDPNAQGSDQWIEAQKNAAKDYYAFVDGLRKKEMIDDKTANMMKAKQALTYEQVRLQQSSEFFGNLASLAQSSNSKIAAIGKAAAIVQATIDGVLAVQKALASAPPPWNYALAAAVGVSAAVNIAKIRGTGFQSGGYTGNMGVNQIAGVVHGQEYVMNAAATKQNMPVLQAMNSGKSIGGNTYIDTKIDIHFDGDGNSSANADVNSNAEFAETLRDQIVSVTLETIMRETRPDGYLARQAR